VIALLAITTDRALGPYIRGRMWMAGIRDHTPLTTALDVLEVVTMDCPADALTKRRRRLDIELATAQARTGRIDRDTWGLS
jgi:hypothetical protein